MAAPVVNQATPVTVSPQITDFSMLNSWQGISILVVLTTVGLTFLSKLLKSRWTKHVTRIQLGKVNAKNSTAEQKIPYTGYFPAASLPEDLDILIPLPNHPDWDRELTQIELKKHNALIYSYDISDIKDYCLLLHRNGTKLEKIAGTTELDPAIILSWIEQAEKITQPR